MAQLNLPGVAAGSDLDELFKSVGFIVIQWGSAEQSLDLITNLLFRDFNGKRFKRKMPKMLEVKLKFVEERVANTPEILHLQSDVTSLVNRFNRFSGIRHSIVHGALRTCSISLNQMLHRQMLWSSEDGTEGIPKRYQ